MCEAVKLSDSLLATLNKSEPSLVFSPTESEKNVSKRVAKFDFVPAPTAPSSNVSRDTRKSQTKKKHRYDRKSDRN